MAHKQEMQGAMNACDKLDVKFKVKSTKTISKKILKELRNSNRKQLNVILPAWES